MFNLSTSLHRIFPLGTAAPGAVSLLVVVRGTVSYSKLKPLQFAQNFLAVPAVGGGFRIANDCVRHVDPD